MYTVLANEVADVDKGLFRQAGRFANGVKALPATDQVFAIKSIRSHEVDSELDCQNSLFITADTDTIYKECLRKEWMEPGILYENNKQYFAELRYDYPLGLVNLTMYFLVPLEDCEFYFKSDDEWNLITFDELRESGDFLWAAQ